MENKVIIVVDDSSVITMFANKILKDKYTVMKASNGSEALELIKNNFDKDYLGMFLDLNMPDFNGFEVLEAFKQNNLFKKIPVCILTGDDTKDSIEKVFEYPIVDVLNKPFTPEELNGIVEKMKLRNS